MPFKPNHPCAHPGCPRLVPSGEKYCEEHRPLHLEEVNRPSAYSRGYGRRWQRESKAFLREHPLCALCMLKDPPKYTKATVVDHIIPHRCDQRLFWDKTNWQALCKECHDRKTLTEDVNPEYHY